jgi:hypothetical protein
MICICFILNWNDYNYIYDYPPSLPTFSPVGRAIDYLCWGKDKY